MQTDDVFQALNAALDRWHDSSPDAPGERIEASLRHIEVFSWAVLAREVREIRLTLQAQHEAELELGRLPAPRGEWDAPASLLEPTARKDNPCREMHFPAGDHLRERPQRCTRRLGHAGEHVDAAGERWEA